MTGMVARAVRWLGGPVTARVVVLLALALALQGADLATLSATADNLERVFGIDNTRIGVLVSLTYLVGALATVPIGVLTDHTRRVRLLAVSIVLWGVATVLSGAATSYPWLMACRMALGMVTATTGPTIASLTGDYFPAASRARMLGLILGGELVGTGIGFVISGEVAALAGWRPAFWWLVAPSAAGAWLIWRLPEPARGGQGRLRPWQARVRDEQAAPDGEPDRGQPSTAQPGAGAAAKAVAGKSIDPDPERVLAEDPTDRSLWWTVRYVLRIRTNVVLIAASALGYFFFAGLRSFALIYVTGHYGLAKSTASTLTLLIGIGALTGVLLGGRGADRLLARGHITVRVVIPSIALLAAGVVFAPALVTTSLALALPLLVVAAALLGATNPSLDAARLDVVHPAVWGRAESVRTTVRSVGEGSAPVLFGLVSERLFGGGVHGLEYTFLLCLGPLMLGGLLALTAVRTYPRDVATVVASAPIRS